MAIERGKGRKKFTPTAVNNPLAVYEKPPEVQVWSNEERSMMQAFAMNPTTEWPPNEKTLQEAARAGGISLREVREVIRKEGFWDEVIREAYDIYKGAAPSVLKALIDGCLIPSKNQNQMMRMYFEMMNMLQSKQFGGVTINNAPQQANIAPQMGNPAELSDEKLAEVIGRTVNNLTREVKTEYSINHGNGAPDNS